MTDPTPAPRINAEEIRAGMAPTPGYRYADRVDDTLYLGHVDQLVEIDATVRRAAS